MTSYDVPDGFEVPAPKLPDHYVSRLDDPIRFTETELAVLETLQRNWGDEHYKYVTRAEVVEATGSQADSTDLTYRLAREVQRLRGMCDVRQIRAELAEAARPQSQPGDTYFGDPDL